MSWPGTPVSSRLQTLSTPPTTSSRSRIRNKPKSILRVSSDIIMNRTTRVRHNVAFDEENVKKTSKRKEAREWCDQAFNQLGDGNNDGFMGCINKAIEIDERYAYPWNLKGVMYAENMNKFQEAIECYNRALKIDSNYVDAWNNKGYALQMLEQLEESKKCYSSAEEAKKRVEALKDLKRVLRSKGDNNEALDLQSKNYNIVTISEDAVLNDSIAPKIEIKHTPPRNIVTKKKKCRVSFDDTQMNLPLITFTLPRLSSAPTLKTMPISSETLVLDIPINFSEVLDVSNITPEPLVIDVPLVTEPLVLDIPLLPSEPLDLPIASELFSLDIPFISEPCVSIVSSEPIAKQQTESDLKVKISSFVHSNISEDPELDFGELSLEEDQRRKLITLV